MFEPRVSGWPRIRSIIRVTDCMVSNPEGSPHHMACADREAAQGLVLFEKEPAGEAYRATLDFAAAHCDAFALVWRDQLPFDPAALELARRLEPRLCFERHTHEWPGPKLWGSKAWVRWYMVTESSFTSTDMFATRPRVRSDLFFTMRFQRMASRCHGKSSTRSRDRFSQR